MNECHWYECLHICGGVAAAQRARWIGDDGIKNLALVGVRIGLIAGIEVQPIEEARDEPTLLAGALRDEFVHGIGHQHDHHRVRIDVRFAPEGGRIDAIETLIEQIGNVVERRGIEAAAGGQGIDVDGHRGLDGSRARDHAVEAAAVHRCTDLEHAATVHRRRTRRARSLQGRPGRWSGYCIKPPPAPLIAESQEGVKAFGVTHVDNVRGSRCGGRRRRENRVAAEPKSRLGSGHTGRDLGHHEVLSSDESRRKNGAAGIDSRIDGDVLRRRENDGIIEGRAGSNMRLSAARTACSRQRQQSQGAQSYQASPDHAPPPPA